MELQVSYSVCTKVQKKSILRKSQKSNHGDNPRTVPVVLTSEGKRAIIKAVRPIHYKTPQTTYNFEVEGFHTYYVGNGVLVHNMNGGGCGGRGSNNPKTKEAAARGREKHKKYDYGPGVKKEETIPGHGRADGIDRSNKIVYELKPDNPRAIVRGLKQLKRYLEGLGEDWIGILITYK